MASDASDRPLGIGRTARRAARRDERPLLLTLGIVLTALRCLGIVLLAGLAGLTDLGDRGLALLGSDPEHLLPFTTVHLDASRLDLALVLAYYGLALLAALLAWYRTRSGLVALLVLSAMGLLHSGALGLTIQAITLLGCSQALGAEREETGAPGI